MYIDTYKLISLQQIFINIRIKKSLKIIAIKSKENIGFQLSCFLFAVLVCSFFNKSLCFLTLTICI